MKYIKIFLIALAGCVFSIAAHAQTMSAIVVSTCGTPPTAFSPPYQKTQDTTGTLCAESTCGVSPPLTYSPGQTYPVLIDSNGKICMY